MAWLACCDVRCFGAVRCDLVGLVWFGGAMWFVVLCSFVLVVWHDLCGVRVKCVGVLYLVTSAQRKKARVGAFLLLYSFLFIIVV